MAQKPKIFTTLGAAFFLFHGLFLAFAGEGAVDLSKLEPEKRFDFLFGEWTYTFDNGEGTTSYQKVAGNAILEILTPGIYYGKAFTGASLFFYDPEKKHWRQSWIDTLGNNIAATGGMEPYAESDRAAMVVYFQVNGQPYKHVWFNISADRFETGLWVSTDGGEPFNLIRGMPYTRKGG